MNSPEETARAIADLIYEALKARFELRPVPFEPDDIVSAHVELVVRAEHKDSTIDPYSTYLNVNVK